MPPTKGHTVRVGGRGGTPLTRYGFTVNPSSLGFIADPLTEYVHVFEHLHGRIE